MTIKEPTRVKYEQRELNEWFSFGFVRFSSGLVIWDSFRINDLGNLKPMEHRHTTHRGNTSDPSDGEAKRFGPKAYNRRTRSSSPASKWVIAESMGTESNSRVAWVSSRWRQDARVAGAWGHRPYPENDPGPVINEFSGVPMSPELGRDAASFGHEKLNGGVSEPRG